MSWTKEQQRAIDVRNKNVLVSAAAGSGKTAVLVERIINMVCEDEKTIDIDKLIVVTFTRAAAIEMKQRIEKAIERKREQYINDSKKLEHLQRQLVLIRKAKIMTIDSFCLDIIKNHFNEIDLDPSFRVADETELKLLKADVLEELLEENYKRTENINFINFVECYSRRNDEAIENIILGLYDFAVSEPFVKDWLNNIKQDYMIENETQLQEKLWFKDMIRYIRENIESILKYYDYMFYICDKEKELLGKYISEGTTIISKANEIIQLDEQMFDNDKKLLEELLELFCKKEIIDFDYIYKVFNELKWLPITRKRLGNKASNELREEFTILRDKAMSLRKDIKKRIDTIKKTYFLKPFNIIIKQIQLLSPIVNEIVDLTIEFNDMYSKKKAENNIVDFNDIEHFALNILIKDNSLEPTETAIELSNKYEEIFIDEYQDSNMLQETILNSIARKKDNKSYNIYMVGDVKQSIYRFRRARPQLFLDKYMKYKDYNVKDNIIKKDDDFNNSEKIILNQNFRSRLEILNFANTIFSKIMTGQLCEDDIKYSEEISLHKSNNIEDSNKDINYNTNIFVIDYKEYQNLINKSQEKNEKEDKEENDLEEFDGTDDIISEDEFNKYELEAKVIVREIKKLKKEHFKIHDKDTNELREIKFSDIVILLRSITGYSEIFTNVLLDNDINTVSDTRTGYFSTFEVQTVISFLKVIDNPRQDIPLCATLRSYFGNITSDELALMRTNNKNCLLYTSMLNYIKDGEDEILKEKLKTFKEELDTYRMESKYKAIHELIQDIIYSTDFYYYVKAMPSGERRVANLEALINKSISYEASSYSGFFNFNRYIEKLKKFEVDFGEAKVNSENEDAVRIMSIHKSKGLEFPVVILAATGKFFNEMDTRERIIFHQKYGIALDYIDYENRIKNKTFIKTSFQRLLMLENLAEELRILYVALTRPKEKLMIIGTSDNLGKTVNRISQACKVNSDILPYSLITSTKNYLEFILAALINYNNSNEFISKYTTVVPIYNNKYPCDYILEKINIEELLKYETKRDIKENLKKEEFLNWNKDIVYNENAKKIIEQFNNYIYPYADDISIHSKMSVSEIKRLEQDINEDGTDILIESKDDALDIERINLNKSPKLDISNEIIPKFIKSEETVKSLEVGTLYHKVLEILKFSISNDYESIKMQIDEMIKNKLVPDYIFKFVKIQKILNFINSNLGKRIIYAEENNKLFKEQRFVIGIQANQINKNINSTSSIIVQGIIDMYFVEDNKVVLLDYKTDKIQKGNEEILENRYKLQLQYYKMAIERNTKMKVKECLIYSLALDKEIKVNIS